MRIWLDAHLSPRIARWISSRFGVEATPVRDLNLREALDPDIWNAARNAGVIVMTKDADFHERVLRLGPPPQVIWLTCGNTSEDRLKEILEARLQPALELIAKGEALVEIHS